MKKLLSLPPNLVECFHDIEKADRTEWFCTSDPIGSKLGSGGGTAWLLEACHQKVTPDSDFLTWLGKEKRILLHAEAGRVVVCPDMRHPAKFLPPFLYSGGPEDNGCHKICFPSSSLYMNKSWRKLRLLFIH